MFKFKQLCRKFNNIQQKIIEYLHGWILSNRIQFLMQKMSLKWKTCNGLTQLFFDDCLTCNNIISIKQFVKNVDATGQILLSFQQFKPIV
ncbi:unnamed protein product [Paramecium sonneborni]|uniref:Uncharacterized protein n=1 Tax=Paramecium sonneborni TaxID=65129 RepID=A0A8S1LG31_9CILI|nr:unnamed protein product [Paramecium sonneborni]